MSRQQKPGKHICRSAGRLTIRLLDGAVNFAVLTAFLLLFALGCYVLWDSKQILQAADTNRYEVYKPTEDKSKSFEELQALNPEVIGWVTVDGTHIDYPVTQASDNDKYVNTDAEGKYSLAGSIFLDYRNQKDFTDFNSILYGHHMADHAMFRDLADFKNRTFFDAHPSGNLYYGGSNHKVDFFACLEADAYDSTIYQPAVTEDGRQEYLNTIFQKALYLRQLQVDTSDHLLLLSTCTSDATNGRHILVGVIREADSAYGIKDEGERENEP